MVSGCASISLNVPIGIGPKREGLGCGLLGSEYLEVKVTSTQTQAREDSGVIGLTLAPSNLLSGLATSFGVSIDPVIRNMSRSTPGT